MQWTKDAKEAIRAVPAGFQRRRAKARIEKTARKLGMTTITLEYAAPMIKEAASEDYQPIFSNKGTGTSAEAEAKLASANGAAAHSNGSHNPEHETSAEAQTESSPCTWTPEAQARLDRAPEGFMRDCTKALILKHAEKIGVTHVTLEVATEGIEQAKGYMADAMKTGDLKSMIADLTGKTKS